jgi:ABC-type transporter Mla MlaB component
VTVARVLVISGSITPADIPGLCRRVGGLLEDSDGPLVCDVGELVDPDAVAIDALARLQLTARRCERHVELHGAGGALKDLLALTGLSEVVPLCAGLRLETRGQAEEREQPRGVEKETDPGNPSA